MRSKSKKCICTLVLDVGLKVMFLCIWFMLVFMRLFSFIVYD
jgi:hypothetical protein